ncbi:MAG TPA: glycosyltransferase family 39 protein [Solirubrobacteraceae bacterium]
MSAPDHANVPARGGLRVGSAPRGVQARPVEGDSATAARIGIRRWSAYAWGALGAVAVFIAITCWWLTKDRGIPIYDAGDQLETALRYRDMLAAGNIFGPFTFDNIYPILGHTVGALAALIGGVSVASPIIGENVVFVPLLALGCYQTGKLLYGPLAGMLAVVFVLGSPLLISMFHVFLLDAPLTALVALAVWLVLASEDFSRLGMSALAGLAVGLGVNMKVQFALFLVCLVLVLLLHGGWRNWRGFAIFTVVALVFGLPWYIAHSSELKEMFELASSGGGTPAGNIPARFSTDNLLWYFWSVLNSQLLAPLFILTVAGAVWTVVTVIRDRRRHAARLEFLVGAAGAWFVITFVTIHHDIRYGMPLLGYLAVLGTGWIACVPRKVGVVGIVVLVCAVAANTLAINLGLGREVKAALASPLPETEQAPDRIVLYSPNGFLASAPIRDGDVPGLFDELHREGVRTVAWSATQSELKDFSAAGLIPLAQIASLAPALTRTPEFSNSPSIATLIHEAIGARAPSACARLSDGTGVWVARYDSAARKLALYCPSRHPQYYDIGGV